MTASSRRTAAVVGHFVTRVGGLVLALPLVVREIGRGARTLLLARAAGRHKGR
ncbi:hypothetical protein ABUW04_11175 [Streptacidiphilus sp. N1-10]|uniref:1-acyl-sn-glycerol-3-phosphate acyltransferase n=1 Tax=Streptacidiphilus jeojiensis TaxID=3229225 RepID=A0ABV6XKR4_9ACTN